MLKGTGSLWDAQTLAEFSNLEASGVGYFRKSYPDFVPQGWWDYQASDELRQLEKRWQLIQESKQWERDAPDEVKREVRRMEEERLSKLPDEVKQMEEEWLSKLPEELERLRNERQWQVTQKLLRDSWRNNFGDGVYGLISLITSIFDPSDLSAVSWERMRKSVFPGIPEGVSEFTLPSGAQVTLPSPPAPTFATYSEMRPGYFPIQRAILYLFENSWRARFCAKCGKRFVAAEIRTKYCSHECSHQTHNDQKLASWDRHKEEWRPKKRKKLRARA